jgi:hypothetical protein
MVTLQKGGLVARHLRDMCALLWTCDQRDYYVDVNYTECGMEEPHHQLQMPSWGFQHIENSNLMKDGDVVSGWH